MRLTAGGLDLDLEPLIDDQERDSRASTGNHLLGRRGARAGGKRQGQGYLDLTGYWRPLRI